jgi:hypothetical protein
MSVLLSPATPIRYNVWDACRQFSRTATVLILSARTKDFFWKERNIMKTIRIVFLSLILLLLFSPHAEARGKASTARPEKDSRQIADLQPLLNAFTAFSEEHIGGILRSLHILSSTDEVRSGEWDRMKGLLAEFSRSGIESAAVWFAYPDGSYYTVEKGLTDMNLSDRPYFSSLLEGQDVAGYLVVSKSTGERSAVIGVPVIKNKKIVGAIGVSMSLGEMSRMIEKKMELPKDMIFYALDPGGRTSLHRRSSSIFAFPSDMGSKTLKEAVNEMLSKQEGVVRYDFFGRKIVVFKRSKLTQWVYAVGIVQGGTGSGTIPPILSELDKETKAALDKITTAVAEASTDLSGAGLEGSGARDILDNLCGVVPYAVDCATVDLKGHMVTVEPEGYRKFEGSDISQQEQIVLVQKSRKPVMSRVFRAVEGFDAVDIEYPVFSPEKEFIGSVSLLVRPDSFFSNVVTPIIQGLPVDVWVMQKDGRIIYDPDTEEIGRMLFEDPLYSTFPELLSLGKTIARKKSGSGSYEFLGRDLKGPVRKDAYWTTVGILGREWRLIVTHNVSEESGESARGLPEAGEQAADESLRDFAQDRELKDALLDKDAQSMKDMLEKFYRQHPGIYGIQWVNARGINLYGYPEENSPLNFDFHSMKTPSSEYILKALGEKKENSFDAPMVEGKEGHFFMVPVNGDNSFLGMIYIIKMKP